MSFKVICYLSIMLLARDNGFQEISAAPTSTTTTTTTSTQAPSTTFKTLLSSSQSPKINNAKIPGTQDPKCLHPVEPGPCHMKLERFYYNSKTNMCEKFIFGGCYGNDNKFGFRKTCEDACLLGGGSSSSSTTTVKAPTSQITNMALNKISTTSTTTTTTTKPTTVSTNAKTTTTTATTIATKVNPTTKSTTITTLKPTKSNIK